MSTMLVETDRIFTVYQLYALGRQSKKPRGGRTVEKGDPALLLTVCEEQAVAARAKFGLTADNKEPVV